MPKKKLRKPDSISGIFLDADLEQMIAVKLPIVKSRETITFENKRISVTRGEFGEVAFIGDLHYGNKMFSKSVTHGYLQYLKEHPNIKIALMGDIIEYGQGSHFIREDDRVPIDDQIAQFIADFKPLADRIIFMLWGNHEERYVRLSKSKRLMNTIALELGVSKECFVSEPQRGVFVTFLAGDKAYGGYFQHSKTSARINQDLQLRRAGSQNVVALIGHGHTHRLTLPKPRTFRVLEKLNNQLMNVVRRQYLMATGCFLKYPPYAEAGSFPYTEVGAPIVKFFADNNEITGYDLTTRYRGYLARGGIAYKHATVDKGQIRDSLNMLISKKKLKEAILSPLYANKKTKEDGKHLVA